MHLKFPSPGGVDFKVHQTLKDGVVKNTFMKEILTLINGIPIRRNFVENLPYNPHLKLLLKEKRKARILGEVIFWKKVRAKFSIKLILTDKELLEIILLIFM